MAGERRRVAGDKEAARRRLGRGLGYATRVQVTAHQFMARRAALGLTRRQVRMESEPGRREWMAILAGLSIVVVICLGALFWSFIKPAGSVGESKIIADQDSGALYVRVGDVLYPALNLSSARLIAGEASNPVRVRRSEIDARPRGVMVGIPGAPNAMAATSPAESSWLVCDAVTKAFGAGAPEPVTVTVLDGQPDLTDGRRRVLEASDGVLLRFGSDVWLIRDGRRSLVDASQRPVLLALGVTAEDLSTARPMSQALFNAIPVAAPLRVPAVPEAGSEARFPGAPGPVGTVVSTPQVEGSTAYSVVLPTGMQTVSPIVAQILQNAGGVSGSIKVVAGSELAALPSVSILDTSNYPDRPLNVVDTQANPATCWWWQKGTDEDRVTTSIVSGASIPVPTDRTSELVKLVEPGGAGSQADQIYFGPDFANFVLSTGNGPTASTQESLWWLSESGVRFGILRDEQTLNALGLNTPPQPAPWAVLRLFAAGPTLSKADALIRHNTLPIDRNPAELEQPR